MALTLELFVRKRLTYQDLNNKIQIPIQNYINQKCVIQDEVSADIAANKIVRRDAQGRVKFGAPEEPEHGARKAEVDAHEAKPAPHSGHATKAEVDAHEAKPAPHSGHATKAEVDHVRNYVESIHHVSLPLGNHYRNTIDPGEYTVIWHVPWKIPAGKTLYLDRAAYHFNNSLYLRLHICSYRSTPWRLLWSSPNASDDLWVGLPLIPPQPTDYITVGIYNSSSEYTQTFDSTSGIWLQFGIV